MKKLVSTIILMIATAGVVWGNADYRYYVPLPEKTFSGDWQFLVEGGVKAKPISELEGDRVGKIEITGYNVLGMETVTYEPVLINALGGFSFSPFTASVNKAASVQSLVFESDVELQGFLWIYNDELGQLNAVRLELESSDSTVIPQIGTNYFVWKSGFSLLGVGQDKATTSDIGFRFYDQEGAGHATDLWSSLSHLGFLKKTPYYDVFLGELDNPISAFWGEVFCKNPQMSLVGFQTFSRVDGSLQTCAFELNDSPLAHGTLPLFQLEESASHWVTLTNAGEQEVQVTLTLQYMAPALVEEEWVEQLLASSIDVSIAPFGRLSGVVGSTWFKELFKDESIIPVRFDFDVQSTVIEESEEPEKGMVYGLAFASVGDVGLAARNITRAGNESSFWLTGQDVIKRTILVQNSGNTEMSCALTIYNVDGKIVGYNKKELTGAATWRIEEENLREILKDVSNAYYFEFKSINGLFSACMLGERFGDISLVNLPLEVDYKEAEESK